MKVEQNRWSSGSGWEKPLASSLRGAQWVLIFGARHLISNEEHLSEIRQTFPKAKFVGCSTAGEVQGSSVFDDSITLTAVEFSSASIDLQETHIQRAEESYSAGENLGRALQKSHLRHVFVLSDGLHVNGTELVRGMRAALPPKVEITGGLAGDGASFQETLIWTGQKASPKKVVAVGLYGEGLEVGYGSLGGWDPFGPDRLITKSVGNVLYELDGKSALDLYKSYLGEHAAGLPATGLLFPLCISIPDNPQSLVRTILSINDEDKSMTFAGDIPKGAYARLMKANFDRLIDGAQLAARTSTLGLKEAKAQLAILISCVGRKLILKQRIEEEVDAVRDVLGSTVPFAGFYSYGEIAPFQANARCELHNQTMTITLLSEAA